MDTWDKQTNKFLQIPSNRMSGSFAETKVQFHQDQVQFLVVHESQIAIYEATKLDCLKQVIIPLRNYNLMSIYRPESWTEHVNLLQWIPRDVSVTHATYSCDSQMIYATFTDGSVSVFTSALRLRCRISPMAYLKTPPRFFSFINLNSNSIILSIYIWSFQFVSHSANTYPVVVAAHPTEPNQLALGLSDGSVHVLEPSDSKEGKWGSVPPPENGMGASSSSSQPVGNPNSDQPPRWYKLLKTYLIFISHFLLLRV